MSGGPIHGPVCRGGRAWRARQAARGALGVTLIELLVAMTIFSVLGIFLFSLMRNSLSIYRSSNASGELYDKFDQAVGVLEDDLVATAVGDPEGAGLKLEFRLSHDRPWVPPTEAQADQASLARNQFAAGDPRSFLLRFVRSFPGGELNDTIGRFAGTYADAEAVIDGVDDLEESRAREILDRRRKGLSTNEDEKDEQNRKPGLKPPANLMEVMYFLDRGPEDLAGTFTLYRAIRSPVGGEGSFFDQRTIERMTPAWVEAHATPLVSGVLFFGVVLWGQNTTSWATDRCLDGEGLGARGAREIAELWWDSSRSRYDAFSLNRGQASAGYFEDDVFPAKAQIVLTVVPEGIEEPDARLLTPLNAQGKNLRVDDPELFDPAGGEAPGYFRIDDEWFKLRSASGRDLVVNRGARQSTAAKHDAGQPVLVGRTFRVTVDIPAHRSWFRGPGEKR
ncbi:MAG: prepilin-type N-terminal cleavage/methylation domain-containing protein [Planctomycetes bacterium]|nr:prepilin-type N-terminal cleavage/methylation domain-containing protein [Planctomycetota bacterium]